MKENENALHSRYVIDGIVGEATPAELLNECMEYPFEEDMATSEFSDIVDESIEPPLSAQSYDSSKIQEYTGLTSTRSERPFRMLYPGHFTRLQIAQALIGRIWSKGHFRLGDLRLWAQWIWDSKPVGNMAAFYSSISETSDYIYGLGVKLTDYVFMDTDGTSSAKFYAWLPEEDSDKDGTDDQMHEVPAVMPYHTILFKAPYESSHPWISEERMCPRTLVDEPDSSLIFIPFDPCSFKLGGSLLAEITGHEGGAAPNIQDPDYFIDCYEVVRELIEDGVILSGVTVGDGGLAAAANTLCQGKGLDLDIGGLMASYQENDAMKVLFGEVPGVLLQVSSIDYEYLDSQLILQDVAYYPVGKPSDEHSGVVVSQSSKADISDILAALLAQASEGED